MRHIDDKKVLPACARDIYSNLENNDETKIYGIYINDCILSVVPSDKVLCIQVEPELFV